MCTTLVFEYPQIISFHAANWLFVLLLNLLCFLYFEMFADFTSKYFAAKYGCHSTSQTCDTSWYKNRSRGWHFLYHLWSCHWNCWISNHQKCNRGIVQRFSNYGLCPVARREGGIWIQTYIKKKKKKTFKEGYFLWVSIACTCHHWRSVHTTLQLRCLAALQPTAQKLWCYCIAVSHEN